MPVGHLLLAAVPWTELIKAAPKMMDSAVKLYENMSGRQPRRPSRGTNKVDDIPALREDLTELQKHLDMLENNDKAQADLIAQMTRHQAALTRWLIMLTLTSVVTGIVAIAALVVAVL